MPVRFLFVMLVSASTLFAAPVKTVIKGELKNGSEKWIRLYEYTNLISLKTKKIAVDSIGKNKTFSFELMIEKGEVKTVFFAVERFKSYDFYVEAGKTYYLVFDSLDFMLQDEFYSPLTSAFPNLEFAIKDDPNDLNNHIMEMIIEFVRFSVYDFAEIAQTRNRPKMNEYRIKLDSLFGHITHSFFQTMLEYSFAEMELAARLKKNSDFVAQYFNDRPFQYDNPAFMNFFNVFFDKYIYTTSRKIPFRDLDLHIVQERNYKGLLDSLGKDELLVNEVVRDMVLIKNLHQMYFSAFYNRESVYNMMQDISTQSKFEKHRQIAADLLTEMNLHKKSMKAPPLIAREIDGQIFNLDSLKGMYTYVFFYTTYCRMCYAEMVVLNNLYGKYNNQVHFVSVSMDVNFLKFYYYMQDYKYPWDFVNFFKNFDIEDEWGVKIYPQAFMLDPNGNIINSNAPMPSEYLDDYFKEILKP